MKDRIKEIIEDYIGIDFNIRNEDGNLFTDLGFDSLDLIEILVSVEKEYNISISNDDADSWQTIDDIVKSCKEYIEAKN